ncbi:AAA family ATPase [Roseomonas xinghualingensis]|uniref:nucleotide-binding protein n=1 Tax=Roseomonas xinghualingensis TaxID=2986475 RepID=UPI0021F198F6|nr:AAA family ATPase [Roseomonas sp. SXEYE001]MCV4207524.1 AAA family ATPase [Roseomonas sp. SXEYE001]
MSMPRLIGIASGKGGVGKTALAIGLTQALAQAGRRVLLADGDLGLANVDVQLGLTVRHDLMAVLAGDVTLREAAIARPEGFEVLPGRSGSGGLAALDPAWITRFLALLRRSPHDDVVLDIGAGLDPVPRRLSAGCDTLLVVATDEPTSLTDAYAVLKLLARDAPRADARVVVNLATDAAQGARTHAALDRACRGFLGRGVALGGVVRRDARMRDAIRHQLPLLTRHPGCNAARDIEALAAGLVASRAAA